jgi:hypothetical protein
VFSTSPTLTSMDVRTVLLVILAVGHGEGDGEERSGAVLGVGYGLRWAGVCLGLCVSRFVEVAILTHLDSSHKNRSIAQTSTSPMTHFF